MLFIDQEQAFDRVQRRYLMKVLTKVNVPRSLETGSTACIRMRHSNHG
jgi:hypothetical protein